MVEEKWKNGSYRQGGGGQYRQESGEQLKYIGARLVVVTAEVDIGQITASQDPPAAPAVDIGDKLICRRRCPSRMKKSRKDTKKQKTGKGVGPLSPREHDFALSLVKMWTERRGQGRRR